MVVEKGATHEAVGAFRRSDRSCSLPGCELFKNLGSLKKENNPTQCRLWPGTSYMTVSSYRDIN